MKSRYTKADVLESKLKQAVIDWAAECDKIGVDEFEKGVCYTAAMLIARHRKNKEKDEKVS